MGDTSFLVFYAKKIDSSYSFVKQFDNIYPVYFDANNESPDIKDSLLNKLFDCYGIPDPLGNLTFSEDTIILSVHMDHQNYEYLRYGYKYEKTKNDWKMIYKIHTVDSKETVLKFDNTNYLSEFNYCNQAIE